MGCPTVGRKYPREGLDVGAIKKTKATRGYFGFFIIVMFL